MHTLKLSEVRGNFPNDVLRRLFLACNVGPSHEGEDRERGGNWCYSAYNTPLPPQKRQRDGGKRLNTSVNEQPINSRPVTQTYCIRFYKGFINVVFAFAD